MKVCTDACVLGAWFACQISGGMRVLDIGSGSGLLMMMLAQKADAAIDGIEIDEPSFGQLQENIERSKWKDKLTAFNGDVRTFSFPHKYDFIITNPPFFENDLLSNEDNLNIAKHSKSLTLEELVQAIDRNLTVDGSFGVLLPYHRLEYFTDLCGRSGFGLKGQLLVKQSVRHGYFRAVLHFSRGTAGEADHQELMIQDESGKYTPEFVSLLKDYYLYL